MLFSRFRKRRLACDGLEKTTGNTLPHLLSFLKPFHPLLSLPLPTPQWNPSHMPFFNICFLSFLSWKTRMNNQTELLLLIVKIISKLPGAVYYISIVIFYPKISNSPASLSALGPERCAVWGCQRQLQPHLLGLKESDPHLQRLRQ